MGRSVVRRGWRRSLSGGAITLLGILLLAIPVYDMWDDLSDFDWSLLGTAVENATFLLLAAGIAMGGVWLVRSDWETRHVTLVAKWTVGGWIVATFLFAWVIYLQLRAMGVLKPYVIAMDGILIGTATTFGLGLVAARADRRGTELAWERQAKASLEALHEVATRLQRTETRKEAYDAVLEAVETTVAPDESRIVIDDRIVARRPSTAEQATTDASLRAPIGDRGWIELVDGDFEAYTERTLDILGTHLDRAIARIERERTIETEREQFALVNRILRHDLRNDVQVLQSRLDILEARIDPPEEHWTVITDRVRRMGQFIAQMQEYGRMIEHEQRELEAIRLPPVIQEAAATVQQSNEEARIEIGELPDVQVEADELLESVFWNLVRNAVEHNDKDTPTVRIDGRRDEETATIEVADNGPGVPDEERQRIRKRGEQLEDSPESGFGLHLVTEAIDAYGGHLEIEDNEPEGAVFRVTLPLSRPVGEGR